MSLKYYVFPSSHVKGGLISFSIRPPSKSKHKSQCEVLHKILVYVPAPTTECGH